MVMEVNRFQDLQSGRLNCFNKSTSSNANLIQKHPHRNNIMLTKCLEIPWPNQVNK
jgi:hypothetical protein